MPLAPKVVELLSGLYREGGNSHVFIGARTGARLGNMAMPDVLEQMGRRDVTVHGFRSTFRDWAAEATAYPNHVVEQALAHTIGNAVEAAYRRGDLFEKRRHLMNDWAAFCNAGQRAMCPNPEYGSMNDVIIMLGTTSTLWGRGPWLGGLATQPSLHRTLGQDDETEQDDRREEFTVVHDEIARTKQICHPRRRSSRRMGATTIGGQRRKISATGSQLRD